MFWPYEEEMSSLGGKPEYFLAPEKKANSTSSLPDVKGWTGSEYVESMQLLIRPFSVWSVSMNYVME